jgi:DNA-binding MarR family transcriptional regulator
VAAAILEGPGRRVTKSAAKRPSLAVGSLDKSVSYKLRLAQIAAFQAFEGRLRGYGAAPRYLGLLTIIEANPDQRQGQLADAVRLHRSTIVPIIDKLEAEGLIERRPSPNDRRSNAIRLTRHGSKYVRALQTLAQTEERRITGWMKRAEKLQFLDMLDKIIEEASRLD